MKPEKTHIYFVPGLAANAHIFEFIKLPSSQFELHFLEWIIPTSKEETLEHYAARMSALVKHQNSILIGVSFGGVLVQEMKALTNPKKIIIISSIKNKFELPLGMRFIQKTKANKLVPYKLLSRFGKNEKYFFTSKLKKKIKLYNKYLSMRDELYLRWSMNTIINWERTDSDNDVIHIHGTDDFVFPAKNIKNYIKISNGTHVMILNKAKKISELLIKILND